MFKLHDTVKLNSTGEHVQIVGIKPIGMRIFYAVEYESGDVATVPETALRPVQSSAGRTSAGHRRYDPHDPRR